MIETGEGFIAFPGNMRKMMMRYTLLILIVILPSLVLAATLSVKQDGSGDYTVIQTALDAANPGDTVLVYPGRYYENLTIQTSSITLMSLEGTTVDPAYIESTIIDGNHVAPCIRVPQGNAFVSIRGFSITNGFRSGSGGGLVVSGGNTAVITNCDIYNNTANNGAGVYMASANVTFSGSRIFNNYSVSFGGGFYSITAPGSPYSIVFDPDNRSSIFNNRAGSGQDIYINLANDNLNIYLDTFSVSYPTNYYAVYLGEDENTDDFHINFDILNAHHSEIDNDLYVSITGDNDNSGLSPATALKTIHEAIYRVASDNINPKTVHVLSGEYSRTDNDQIFPIALKSWVIVQGSGIDTTTVVGEPHPTIIMEYGYADRVFVAHGEESTIISNMSITTRNTLNGCAVNGRKSSTISLANLSISGVTPNHDAVISLWTTSEINSYWDSVSVTNVITSLSGLVAIEGAVSGKISNCVFSNATSTYYSSAVPGSPLVGIRGDRRLEIENCVFEHLAVEDNDTFVIAIGAKECPQQQNHYTIKNCLFENIYSHDEMIGFGSVNNPRIDITNCTFAGNQGDAYTLIVNGDVNITNSIFYNDTPYQIKVNPMDGNPNEHTNLTIDHSLVKDGIAGILPYPVPGNTVDFLPSSINADPLFAGGLDIHDPEFYSLSEFSPCINSGTPDTLGLYLPPYDLAGNWRIWNNRIDMGCFEYGSEPWVTIDDPVLPVPDQLVLQQNYPNPFNPTTTIAYSLPEASHVRLDIYNVKGQLVKTLINGEMPAGMHSVVWDGRDSNNTAVASGVYFYRVSCPKVTQTKRMLLMK